MLCCVSDVDTLIKIKEQDCGMNEPALMKAQEFNLTFPKKENCLLQGNFNYRSQPTITAISGVPCSGKSMLLCDLIQQLLRQHVNSVFIDPTYPDYSRRGSEFDLAIVTLEKLKKEYPSMLEVFGKEHFKDVQKLSKPDVNDAVLIVDNLDYLLRELDIKKINSLFELFNHVILTSCEEIEIINGWDMPVIKERTVMGYELDPYVKNANKSNVK